MTDSNVVSPPATASRIGSREEAVATARALAHKLAPGALHRDRSGRFPREELQEIARSGLLAITVPEQFGGLDAPVETVVDVVRILSVADPSIGQLTLSAFVVAFFIKELAAEELQERLFADIRNGARFGNASQPSRNPEVRAIPAIAKLIDQDTIEISGEKYYSTGAVAADYVVVNAVDESGEAVSVVVPGDAEGLIVVEDDWDAFGQRATVSGTVRLDKVRVRSDSIWSSQRLFTAPSLFPAVDHIQHAAVDVGIARAALADAAWFVRDHANPAREFVEAGRAVDDPYTVHRFGVLRTKLNALEALARENARLIDSIIAAGDSSPEALARAASAGQEVKALANDVGVEIAGALFELTGTSATAERYGLDRHWRNVRVHSINVANRWRYNSIGQQALAELPAESPTRIQSEKTKGG